MLRCRYCCALDKNTACVCVSMLVHRFNVWSVAKRSPCRYRSGFSVLEAGRATACSDAVDCLFSTMIVADCAGFLAPLCVQHVAFVWHVVTTHIPSILSWVVLSVLSAFTMQRMFALNSSLVNVVWIRLLCGCWWDRWSHVLAFVVCAGFCGNE